MTCGLEPVSVLWSVSGIQTERRTNRGPDTEERAPNTEKRAPDTEKRAPDTERRATDAERTIWVPGCFWENSSTSCYWR